MDDLFANQPIQGQHQSQAPQATRKAGKQPATTASGTPVAAPNAPLAARMRPQVLDDIVGQQHLLGADKLLRRAIVADRFSALILYGPPGVGKTSIAHVIANSTECHFHALNAIESNIGEVRAIVEQARQYKRFDPRPTLLFVDEIHRFNKAQQDILLPYIEQGELRFIGATTHNPLFYINGPLVSRAQVFQLEPLAPRDIIRLLEKALSDTSRGLGHLKLKATPEALQHLAEISDGDPRRALSALELAALTLPDEHDSPRRITLADAEQSIQQKAVQYGADGHYDTISAFIKSIRGGDPDAAIYWLAKMLHVGEDIRFIARRLVIAASEDIGLADSSALQVAIAAQQAVEFIGMPEARIPLAHATIYLATSPKSNSAYRAINAALDDVRNGVTLAVPPHLRTPTRKKLSAASGTPEADLKYHYSHDPEAKLIPQAYLPEGKSYYSPLKQGKESRIAERLDFWKQQFADPSNTNL